MGYLFYIRLFWERAIAPIFHINYNISMFRLTAAQKKAPAPLWSFAPQNSGAKPQSGIARSRLYSPPPLCGVCEANSEAKAAPSPAHGSL
jgi:hypothetical protein